MHHLAFLRTPGSTSGDSQSGLISNLADHFDRPLVPTSCHCTSVIQKNTTSQFPLSPQKPELLLPWVNCLINHNYRKGRSNATSVMTLSLQSLSPKRPFQSDFKAHTQRSLLSMSLDLWPPGHLWQQPWLLARFLLPPAPPQDGQAHRKGMFSAQGNLRQQGRDGADTRVWERRCAGEPL